MLGNPVSIKGAISWVIFGLVAAVMALLVSTLFPSFIPASATTVKL
jgi:hypothetical protein